MFIVSFNFSGRRRKRNRLAKLPSFLQWERTFITFDAKDSAILSFFKCLATFIICQDKGYPKLKSIVYCMHRAKIMYREVVRACSPSPLLDCIGLVRDFMLPKLSAYFSSILWFGEWRQRCKSLSNLSIQSIIIICSDKISPFNPHFSLAKGSILLDYKYWFDSFQNQWGATPAGSCMFLGRHSIFIWNVTIRTLMRNLPS